MAFSYTLSELGKEFQVTVFTLNVTHDKQEFFCLVRAKTLENTVQYSLTLLNQEMEEILAEPFTVTEREQVLQIDAPGETDIYANVKFASVVALRKYLAQNESAGTLRARYTA